MGEIELSQRDRELLAGAEGTARQMAMRILLRMAEVQGAKQLIDVTRAHIDGCIYTGEASLQFAEMLADAGGQVHVPTSMNAISIDRKAWRTQGVDPAFAHLADRLATAYERMGAKPTFTCSPYQLPEAPVFGEHIAWAESNAVVYANSVIGARTNRYGDFMDICAALTGRAPLAGFHLDKARLGTVLIDMPEYEKIDSTFYPVLGYLIGSRVGSGVPVIRGIKEKPSADQLKAFGAAVATGGAVGMFHMIRITPEASTLEEAFGGYPPLNHWQISPDEIADVWRKLSTASEKKVDLVLMGSPHFSFEECVELAQLVEGKQCHPDVRFFITTSHYVYEKAKEAGVAKKIEAFGATFLMDICLCMISTTVPHDCKTLMTNSGKFAHYGPGLVDREIYFGGMDDCVQTAITSSPKISIPDWLKIP
ncbi:hypothetical protein BRE01_63210 [Brevibacillus reuszeri]|uniref:aconitate hydratase n=1 Tax=Brevibacillus reuszeri TaxID=54915 RepID=A0ABQ0TXU2_9BACL|nr:aconitase X catalytic domain-containing protein [Brevibacillus reuszeri]MED1859313.1 aconitase X catalytic domain-containing protein [Brevibacillus reuszeri]GED72619.1 hypothetical protein BRE01_63210 [Brevibacillus reuszeri]